MSLPKRGRDGGRGPAVCRRYPFVVRPGDPAMKSSELDLHVNARSQIELHQRVDGLGVRLHDVEQPLVGAHLELLARLLVDVRAAVHGELLDARRQRNGAPDERAGAACGIRDLAGRLVEHAVIEGLQANADILSVHVLLPMSKSQSRSVRTDQKTRDRPASPVAWE